MWTRQMRKEDYTPVKRLFDKACEEYLEFLHLSNPQRYSEERRERKEVTSASFDFFLEAGSSFAAQEKGEVIGYVMSQTISDLHGINDVRALRLHR